MNSPQLIEALKKAFSEERARYAYNRALVFWYDPERAFIEDIEAIASQMVDVKLARLDTEGALQLKIQLELEDAENSYLIYAPFAEPTLEEADSDWFLSTRLYSRIFHADEVSFYAAEFGLISAHWREFLRPRLTFFQDRKRREKLKKMGVSDADSPEDFDAKLIAVSANADYAEITYILPPLFAEFIKNGAVNLESTPESYKKLERFDLADSFWSSVQKIFGYKPTENPQLNYLLRRLMATDFVQNLRAETPKPLESLVLKNSAAAAAFLAAWRDSTQDENNYRLLAEAIENDLNVRDLITNLAADELSSVQTFAEIEKHILREVRDALLQPGALINFDKLKAVLDERRSSFWASRTENTYSTVIDALNAALELFRLRRKYENGFSFSSQEEVFGAYTNELYLFDQLYRHYHEAALKTSEIDVLKSLTRAVEDCYLNWFMPELATVWSKFIADQNGEIKNWKIPEITAQHDFYRKQVAPILEKHSTAKVYVIVSDAFRYEAATELVAELNHKAGERKVWETEMNVQLGVLPSYTKLGMASLLPHSELTFSADASDVLVDGISSQGIENRRRILAQVNGAAIHLKDLRQMKTEQGREFVRPHRVVYIYHDEIDETGDTAASEHQTFTAVRNTINEIQRGIDFIVKSLDGTHIFVTADHGFLFQQSEMESTSKSKLLNRPTGTLYFKKRYLLGKNLGFSDKAWFGKTAQTAGTTDQMEFWIPRGANRFHFSGGARFVHGGAMPQEITVPAVYLRVLHGKAAEKAVVRPVDVILLGSSNRIVTNIYKLELLQTEAVGERRPPRTLVISLQDGARLLSNEVTVVFDSAAESLDQRKKTAQIFLKPGEEFDRRKEYALVLRDAKTNVEYRRTSLFVDLALSSDF